ncbi:MAG TPA: hypothetical protein VLG48_10395, partial [Candidatus Methylomirabilis sp.]|nr:hypothetical protein [Candidatus Methylomirabilis sp.]
NILEQTVMVALETGGQVTLGASEVTVRPRPAPPRGERPMGGTRGQPAPAEASAPPEDVPPDVAALEDA